MWIQLSDADVTAARALVAAGKADPATATAAAAIESRLDTYAEAGDAAYVSAADDLEFVREGQCEIDSEAVVSIGDEGAYVMAWVYVPNEMAGIEDDAANDDDDDDGTSGQDRDSYSDTQDRESYAA